VPYGLEKLLKYHDPDKKLLPSDENRSNPCSPAIWTATPPLKAKFLGPAGALQYRWQRAEPQYRTCIMEYFIFAPIL